MEGASSFGKVSKYGDIWALGCILFKLATTGRSSAFTSDWRAVAYKQQHARYDVPQLDAKKDEGSPELKLEDDGFRDEINSILKGCFAREPKERPTSEQLLKRFAALKSST
jgi:serine/threonine protein kinase